MEAHIGTKITLPTNYGNFDVQHVIVQYGGNIIREGVVLQRITTRRPIIVRVQSSCLFSETFWATDCDCALQLQASLLRINRDGGIVLYFYEEGRGAGLMAKFKAIELQQLRGLNTQQAYECLQMKLDPRSYEAAAVTLQKLVANTPLHLLSNNLGKMDGLKAHRANIVSREQLIVGDTSPAVRRYLDEKRNFLKHDIPIFK